ncbi:formylglycine-generating enzyme family protein [Anatilimnocola sp. NA78]|uniref:formylglycine-generating enzyme family protein n=1 Tax=Anatilimnocola sp. NA78 TaxID=3415683 RepID=UPI003CE59E9B
MRRFCGLFLLAVSLSVANGQDAKVAPLEIPDSAAKTEAEMKPYTELLEHSEGKIDMLPIKGGKFLMGSPESEKGRRPDEGPQHEVQVDPFWMAKFEITWDAYEVWSADLDIFRRDALGTPPNERDKAADKYQLTQPTKPYTDMSFGMGKRGGFPAICMTQHSARVFCQWLSAKTGRYYRLPTEAEWEYACRAGTATAFSFGDDPAQLDDYGWYLGNTEEKYKKVGLKKPNPWGLYDMHGNVAEWVLDQHTTDFYSKLAGKTALNPLAIPLTEYNRVVRGGSWDSEAVEARSAARKASHADWKQQDPQLPQSIWYLTDALGVGFRVVRPLTEPTAAERAAKWDKSEPPQIDKVQKTE